MYCWTQSPNPIASANSASGRGDLVLRHASAASNAAVPASSVTEISATPTRLQYTSDGGPMIVKSEVSHATGDEKRREIRTNWTPTNAAKNASVTAWSASTLEPAMPKTSAAA